MDATFQRGICTVQFLLLSKFFTGLDMAPLTKLQVWISMATFKACFSANFWKITYAESALQIVFLAEIKILVNLFKSLITRQHSECLVCDWSYSFVQWSEDDTWHTKKKPEKNKGSVYISRNIKMGLWNIPVAYVTTASASVDVKSSNSPT